MPVRPLFELFSHKSWESAKIAEYDVSGYYLYLPAVFIYKDLEHLDFYPRIDSEYHTGSGWYGIYRQQQTGNRLDKYPPGVAIGELPLFLMAHAYTCVSGAYKADGYSLPYQRAIVASNFLWVLVGLLFLGKFLKGLWGADIAAVTLLIIAFGTNLYCYTITNLGMSHPFLFLLFAMILYYTRQWTERKHPRYLYVLGILCGWVLISRVTDVFILLFPLLWGVSDHVSFKDRVHTLQQQGKHLLLSLLCFAGIVLLYISYLKMITGSFFHFPYEGEGFNFKDPTNITDGLISYRKGWFVYTPVALLGLCGLIPLYRRYKSLCLLTSVYFVLVIYVVFSWAQWAYGWSFGCRPLIESLAVLGIPLGALINYMFSRKVWLRVAGFAVGGFCIWLNLYQTHQYITCALPGDGITKEYYWRVWNCMHATDEDRSYLEHY